MFSRTRKTGQDPVARAMVEPSEARFRVIAMTFMLVALPVVLLFLYYRLTFPGLVNPDAMDYAQLGRNISAGRGFSTSILRPLALTHGTDPLHQPDVTHGPLYPFVLAVAFGALGARDSIAAYVSGLFFLLTIPALYLLGLRLFSRPVALVVTGIFSVNSLMMEYAASGLPLTLAIFLMTCLMLALHRLFAHARDHDANPQAKLPRNAYIAAGLLTALLYLTEPIYFWMIPVVLVAVLSLSGPRKLPALLWFGLPLALFVFPWMIRNASLTGNPIFGLRGTELFMYTQNQYPALTAYRMTPDEITPSPGLFMAVIRKIGLGIGGAIQNLPMISNVWILAFILPSLLFRFTDSAATNVRRVMVWSFLALLGGMLLFQVSPPIIATLFPIMLVFAVAYLLYLLQQAQLTRLSRIMASALIGLTVVYPLFADLTLRERVQPNSAAAYTDDLKSAMRPNEVALSDQPWVAAWYADRPSLWLPATDRKVEDFRKKFKGLRWIFLTEQSANVSLSWRTVYQALAQYNQQVALARAQGSTNIPRSQFTDGPNVPPVLKPLWKALDGFEAVAPSGAPGRVSPVVMAAVPLPQTNLGERSGAAPSRTASAAGNRVLAR